MTPARKCARPRWSAAPVGSSGQVLPRVSPSARRDARARETASSRRRLRQPRQECPFPLGVLPFSHVFRDGVWRGRKPKYGEAAVRQAIGESHSPLSRASPRYPPHRLPRARRRVRFFPSKPQSPSGGRGQPGSPSPHLSREVRPGPPSASARGFPRGRP